MSRELIFKVDGGCRGNGSDSEFGAAAAVLFDQHGERLSTRTTRIDFDPRPTHQRAELIAIITALHWARTIYERLDPASYPTINVTIMSDSQYAVNCMTTWVREWSNNGWITTQGRPVVNRDLLILAVRLEERVKQVREVHYVQIPRDENRDAEVAVNRCLISMQQQDS